MNHTPGPWKIERLTNIGTNVFALVNDTSANAFATTDWDANAKLIEAAPELLLACQGMLNVVRLWPHVSKDEVEAYLMEVIAKAEGKKCKQT